MSNCQVKDSNKWMVLVISFLMMMGFSLSRLVLPPIFDQMIKDVFFTNSQAGMLMGAYAVPGIFLPFFIAYLANRYDLKKLIAVALIIMIVGLIAFSIARTFPLLLLSRLIAGVGATVLVVLAPLLITMYFDQNNIGIAMGIFNIAGPVGTVVAANLFGYAGRLVGWRAILVGVAGYFAVLLVLVIIVLSLSRNKKATDPKNLESRPSTRKFSGGLYLWLLGVIWALANAQLLAYMTFGPQFYQSLGISVQKAGFLTSLIMLVTIFVTPIVGILFDKTSRKKPYFLLGNLIAFISFVFIANNFLSLPLWAAVLGIGFAPIAVFVFSYLPEVVKPEQLGMGLGLLTVAQNLGSTLGPTALGSVLDLTNRNFFVAMMALAMASLVVTSISFWLKSKAITKKES